MTLQLEITHPDDSTETVNLSSVEIDQEIHKEDVAWAYADRDDIRGLNQLNEGFDHAEVIDDGTTEFGGPLEDIRWDGAICEILVESHERYARDSKPTPGGEHWQNAGDNTIISDAISDVSELSEGTIERIQGGLDMVFSHASPAKKMRTVAESTGGELLFHADGAVDYVEELGSDSTSIVISPATGSIQGELTVETDSAEQYTHLRVVGAGEGEAQVSVEVISDDYSPGDSEKWGTFRNSELTDESVLQSWGDALIDELNETKKTARGDINDDSLTINIGDEFSVQHSRQDFDEELRATRVTTIIDNNGTHYEVEFSNRSVSPDDKEQQLIEDADKYHLAFEGSSVWGTPGGGRQPVSDTVNYSFDFYYPDEIEYEHRVKLQVKGDAYRYYSSPESHQHDLEGFTDMHSHESGDDMSSEDHTHPIDLLITSTPEDYDSTFFHQKTTLSGQTHPAPTYNLDDGGISNVQFMLTGYVGSIDPPGLVDIRAYDGSSTSADSIFEPGDGPAQRVESNGDPFNLGGVVPAEGRSSGDLTLQIFTFDDSVGNEFQVHDVELAVTGIPDHIHDVDINEDSELIGGEPGVSGSTDTEFADLFGTTSEDIGVEAGVEETSEYPQDVDVLVNGQSQGVSFGDPNFGFEETVDIGAGVLNQGAWNTIEVTSSNLGHIQAVADLDVYRQILGDG